MRAYDAGPGGAGRDSVRRIPCDLELEQGVIGALLTNGGAYDKVASFLKTDHFFEPLHAQIFDVVGALTSGGKRFDPITIRTYLDPNLMIGDMTLPEYLARLTMMAATMSSVADHAEAVRRLWVRRRLLSIADDLSDRAMWGNTLADEAEILIDAAQTKLEQLAVALVPEETASLPAQVKASVSSIDRAFKSSTAIGMAPWFLDEIGDVMDGDIEANSIYGLLGGSKEGKSGLALMQCRAMAERGVPTQFLSGEQSVEQCIHQMHAQRLGIPASVIKAGFRQIEKQHGRDWAEEAFRRIEDDAKALSKLPLEIKPWDAATSVQLMIKARGFQRAHGTRVFVAIDHANALDFENPRANFAEQISSLYRPFKRFAMATGSTVLVLMQRNSDFKTRENPVPTRGDLYGGERVMQHFDGIMALYRPAVWLRERLKMAETEKDKGRLGSMLANAEPERGVTLAEFHCLKARFGDDSRHKQVVDFVGKYTRFASRRDAKPEQERFF